MPPLVILIVISMGLMVLGLALHIGCKEREQKLLANFPFECEGNAWLNADKQYYCAVGSSISQDRSKYSYNQAEEVAYLDALELLKKRLQVTCQSGEIYKRICRKPWNGYQYKVFVWVRVPFGEKLVNQPQ